MIWRALKSRPKVLRWRPGLNIFRHHERRTKADASSYQRIRALHRGPGEPRVRRMIERQVVPLHDDTPLKPRPDEV